MARETKNSWKKLTMTSCPHIMTLLSFSQFMATIQKVDSRSIVCKTYIFNFQTTYVTRKGNFSVLEYEPLKSPPRLRLAEIIPILLILRHIIDRSWKPLETKSWKPIKTNSDKKMLVSEKELSNFKFKRFKKYWCKLKIT